MNITLTELFEQSISPDENVGRKVDVGFVGVMVSYEADKALFMDWLQHAMAGESEFPEFDPDRFRGGVSYIELGAYLGSQQYALMLMGLGAFHEVWKILTPANLGITDEEQARDLMGTGLIYISPLTDLFPGHVDMDDLEQR